MNPDLRDDGGEMRDSMCCSCFYLLLVYGLVTLDHVSCSPEKRARSVTDRVGNTIRGPAPLLTSAAIPSMASFGPRALRVGIFFKLKFC